MKRVITIKEIILNLHGKKDGKDPDRYAKAEALSAQSKLSSQMPSLTTGECFAMLVKLESKGKITLKDVMLEAQL